MNAQGDPRSDGRGVGRREMGDGRGEMGDGRWEMGLGRWEWGAAGKKLWFHPIVHLNLGVQCR
jgi:hypothetical protein